MEFNLTRFGALVKRDFIIYKKQILLIALSSIFAVGAIWFLTLRTQQLEETLAEYWMSWYVVFLGVALLLTSVIFREFKTPSGRMQYLAVPASHLEKLVSRWSYSLILYPVFISLVIIAFASTVVDTGTERYTQDVFFIKYIIHAYILAHAVQLIYAIVINKNVAFKTFLISIVTFIGTVLLIALLFYIIFHDYIPKGSYSIGPNLNLRISPEAQNMFSERLPRLGLFFGKYILPPYLWVVAYFKLKEKEV